jgi:glycosyltransferase involved in cell wall biosynthesis
MAGRAPEGLISVLIPVFNNVAYLAEAIDSVLAQTYRPLELIVADDGSTDGTGDVARDYGDAIVYDYQPRAGQGATRNRAIRLSSGEFVSFLDADDRFAPDKLELQYAALRDNPDVDMVFGYVREFVSSELSEEQRLSVRPPAPPSPWPASNLMLIRRDALLKVGPFAETLKVGVGIDWSTRALESGLQSMMLREIVLERRLHLENNGLRERDSRSQLTHVLKASLDRRRAESGESPS